MWIEYRRNDRTERAAAFRRTLAFLWVLASEGEGIHVMQYIDAPVRVAR